MPPKTILPNNVSDLERDLELALARIEQIKLPIATLWDPWQCPISVLPFLAWALSVDQWHSHWPDIVKRRVVANTLSVHRNKGTRRAVEQALSDLGVNVDLVEWFEQSPQGPPGTFEVTAWVNENITPQQDCLLNAALYAQIQRAIVNSKNARSHYNLKVGAQFGPDRIAMALAMTANVAIARKTAQSAQAPLTSEMPVGMVALTTGITLSCTVQALHHSPQPKAVGCGIASVLWGYHIIYQHMKVSV